MPGIQNIIMVGAGPTGLLLALLLSQHGISVQVVESQPGVDQRPRGLAYGPSAIQVLRRAGVLDEIRKQSMDIRSMSWRNLQGEVLVSSENMDDQSPDRFVNWPVHMLSNLLLEHVKKQPKAEVLMSHPVDSVGQDDQQAWVDVKLEGGKKRLYADYIVGCDGANSIVRRSLCGETNFPGFTWDRQLVVTNIYYDFEKYNWSDAQWIVDPKDWGMVCAISKKEKLWRVGYGVEGGLSYEELHARLPSQLEKMLPGHPKPGEYEVVRFSPFQVHQRCVDHMRIGRFLLAGDAAHLCNPMGGLGLTSGLSDIGSLVDCFYGIHDGKVGPSILDKYDEVRVQIYKKIINPVTSANLERLWQDPEAIRHTDPFFQMLRNAATDPQVAKDLQLMQMGIAHDMTQYYDRTEQPEQDSYGHKTEVSVIENVAALA